jgi:hypothetical protein
MANLMKYLEEQGMEVPAAPQPSPEWARARRYTGSVRARGGLHPTNPRRAQKNIIPAATSATNECEYSTTLCKAAGRTSDAPEQQRGQARSDALAPSAGTDAAGDDQVLGLAAA